MLKFKIFLVQYSSNRKNYVLFSYHVYRKIIYPYRSENGVFPLEKQNFVSLRDTSSGGMKK